MKVLYFLIGAPGSGKSTFLENISKEIYGNNELLKYVLSPDKVREIVSCPEDKPDGTRGINNTNEKFVWKFIKDALEKKVDKGELIIMDATHSRAKAISAYKNFSNAGYRVIGIDFSKNLDIDTILERNKMRDPVKYVPEMVIRSMHERCQNLEVPTWVEIIEPENFKEHYTDVIKDFNGFDEITVIGDIHGCLDEFKDILGGCGLDPDHTREKTAVVLVGDYFDRGYDVVNTFKTIRNLQKNNWVLALMGNHEEPLLWYKEFIKDISDYIKDWIHEEEKRFAQREQLLEESNTLMKEICHIQLPNSVFSKIVNFFTRLRYGDCLNPEKELSIWYKNQQITTNAKIIEDIPEYEEEALKLMRVFKQSSYKHWDTFVEKMRQHPIAFSALTEIIWKYKLPPELVKNPDYGFHRIKRTSLGTMKRFALSDIKYTDIMDFVKRLGQLFYIEFHGQKILVTHGGLVKAPDKATPTSDMIRGVGGYEDAELCMQTFTKSHPNIIQIHGHRNMTNLPIQITDTTFNINGDVDLGVRAVTFFKDGTISTTEVTPKQSTKDFFRESQIKKAQKFKAKKLSAEEEGKGLLTLFQDHQHVDVKKLPNNIAAINFTKKAFDNGIWDHITIKARGLFVKIEENIQEDEITVVARGYQKFFNVGERYGFKTRDIRELAYPMRAYEKANGYLGLLSVVDNQWFTSSKSTTEGDFAKKFKEMITPSLTDALKKKMQEENITLVFEVVEPIWDPHIELYNEPELIILDLIYNDINFRKLPYEKISEFIEIMKPQNINIREKRLIKVCENFNDYWTLVSEANKHPLLSNDGIEGFVFEDASNPPNLFKLKTDWYSFWKYMRSLKIRVSKRIRKHLERTGKSEMEKSDRIALKQQLHRVEDFKVFHFMVDLAEENLEEFDKMSIIEVREKFLNMKK